MAPKRILFNIDEKLHMQIKISAAKRNITMTKWILRAVMERIRKEEQYNEENNV